jgi:hypothetical protein
MRYSLNMRGDGTVTLLPSGMEPPGFAETTVVLTGLPLSPEMEGKEIRVAVPGDPDNRYRVARVQYASGSLTLWEPTTSATGETVAELMDQGAPFAVYDSPSGLLDGRWTDNIEFVNGITWFTDAGGRQYGSEYETEVMLFKSGNLDTEWAVASVDQGRLGVSGDKTGFFANDGSDRYQAPDLVAGSGERHETLTGIWTTVGEVSGDTELVAEFMASFSAHMVGWKLIPNVRRPSYHTIIAVTGNDQVTVAGDLTSPALVAAGDWFRVVPPYGADVRAGDEASPETQYPRNNLWAGMRWMPPEIPAAPDSPGTYHGWHRVYDARTGRWTTPDPAATPWWNLQDYVGGRPLTATDPTGLLSYDYAPGNSAMADSILNRESTYQRRTGVQEAIQEKTMTKAAHDGQAYEKQCECCTIGFKFLHAYQGKYELSGRGTDWIWGVYVSLRFAFEGTKCNGGVSFIQVARDRDRNGNSLDPIDRRRRDRGGWSSRGAASRGWGVDTSRDDSAYYNEQDAFGLGGTQGLHATNISPGELRDAPGMRRHFFGRGAEFLTCAICRKEPDGKGGRVGPGSVLGCLRWGYQVSDTGSVAWLPSPSVECGAPQELKDAIGRWNGQAGAMDPNIAFGEEK